jgi:glycosyltransferase involved in cell wall biosynthesis
MELRAEDITIAVTVYSRRDYVCEAIRSALGQTVPVQVIVVEDCGPDPGLREFILQEFGGRITYYRNPKNRGLFDNWHACMEYSRTPWLSILHDDDLLRPNFVENLLEVARAAPGRALYFGRQARLEADGLHPAPPVAWEKPWADIDLIKFADVCYIYYPGQLFRIADARAIGGFRTASYFTGDWDMWFRLTVLRGGVQSAAELAVVRGHDGADRGTSVVVRKGWKWALDNLQRKRNLALLSREKGIQIPFDRVKLLQDSPIPTRVMLRNARHFTRRMLRYNWWLFTHSRPPHWRYAALQWIAQIIGPKTFKISSLLTLWGGPTKQ